MRTLILAFVAIAMLNTAQAVTLIGATYDDFSTAQKWKPFSYGTGKPYSSTVNGQLKITLPADSSRISFAAGYTSLCLFRGDFDVQTDYYLFNFLPANGVRVGLVAGSDISSQKWGSGAAALRISTGTTENPPSTEAYQSSINFDCCHTTPTTDTSGKLRVTRTGSVMSSYFFNKSTSSWQLLNQNQSTASDTSVEIGAWSHDSVFADTLVTVAFDNFIVNSGNAVGASCPIK